MARNTQLSELLYMLRAEVGHSTSVATGVDNVPALTQKLKRAQVMLYDDYDWPFMRIKRHIELEAGERYYDMPEDMDSERIEDVWLEFDGQIYKVTRGIGKAEYANYNSENDERNDPLQNWDLSRDEDADTEQVEAWPIPAVNGGKLWFQGFKKLRALVQQTDRADLDDILIVLTAASEILSRAKQADATAVRDAASARLRQLKVRTKGAERTYTMGTGRTTERETLGRPTIIISSNTN